MDQQNNEAVDLKAIETIIKIKPKIEQNPFSNLPKDALENALKVLEEFSQEINP